MLIDTQPKDIRTKAYVLRRTNYGEADRVLNLITPTGKMSAMAKGVRREKSKLAGGIEMFCLIELNIHQGKNDFGVVTGARMLKCYGKIVIDLRRMELASMILKKISTASENSDNPDFFDIVNQTFEALEHGMNPDLVETWFLLNLARANGEEVNLYRDTKGDRLSEESTYVWDTLESALKIQLGGNIGSNEIKLMRLILTSKLNLIDKVKDLEKMLPSVLYIAKSINKI